LTDEEFITKWPENFLRICDEKSFTGVFEFGIDFYTSKQKNGRWKDECVYLSEIENTIEILLTDDQMISESLPVNEIFRIIKPNLLNCTLPDCGRLFHHKTDMTRHQNICRTLSKIKYSEFFYGGKKSTFQKLVDIGVIEEDDPILHHFCTFDIESIGIPKNTQTSSKTFTINYQEAVSIALSSTFSEDFFVLRDSMSHESGLKMVSLFIKELNRLKLIFEGMIPDKLKRLKIKLGEKLQVSPRKIW
jgi:hypothetical protein